MTERLTLRLSAGLTLPSAGVSTGADPAPTVAEDRYAGYPADQLRAMLRERDRSIQDLRTRLREEPPSPVPSERREDKLVARALDRSLVRQGASLLPPGSRQAVLSVTQSLAEKGRRGDRTLAVAMQVGLPGHFQLDASMVPYRAQRESGESHWPRLGVSHDFTPEKRLDDLGVVGAVSWQRSALRTSVATVRDDTVDANLSLSKHLAPVVLTATGGLSELRSTGNSADGQVSIRTWALGGTISLDLSPDLAVNLGVDVSHTQAQSQTSGDLPLNEPHAVTLRLGLDTSMNTALPVSLFLGIRVMGEQPRFSMGLSFPYAF